MYIKIHQNPPTSSSVERVRLTKAIKPVLQHTPYNLLSATYQPTIATNIATFRPSNLPILALPRPETLVHSLREPTLPDLRPMFPYRDFGM